MENEIEQDEQEGRTKEEEGPTENKQKILPLYPGPGLHPGRVITKLIAGTPVSPVLLAMAMGVPYIWVKELIACRRDVGQLLADKLGDYFRNGSEWWLREQHLYDAMRLQESHRDMAEVRSLAEFVRFENKLDAGRSPLDKIGMRVFVPVPK